MNPIHSKLVIVLYLRPEDVKVLSPNGRPNPHQLARVKQKVRAEARETTRRQLRKLDLPDEILWIGCSIHRVTKTAVIPDSDNTEATMKCVIDGICEHIGVNDKQLIHYGVTFEKDRGDPRWEITLHYEQL